MFAATGTTVAIAGGSEVSGFTRGTTLEVSGDERKGGVKFLRVTRRLSRGKHRVGMRVREGEVIGWR